MTNEQKMFVSDSTDIYKSMVSVLNLESPSGSTHSEQELTKADQI